MNQKKAKAFRRIAAAIVTAQQQPLKLKAEYKRLKKNYKDVKGEK